MRRGVPLQSRGPRRPVAVGRRWRSDVVGIFPNDESAVRLAGALPIEQSRRYLSEESLALVLVDQGKEVQNEEDREEVPQLQAA